MRDQFRQLAHDTRVIEQVAHDLVYVTAPRELARQRAHRVLGRARITGQVAHPRRIEAPRMNQRQQLLRQRLLARLEAHRMRRQMQPRPASRDFAAGHQRIDERAPQRIAGERR